MVQPQPHSLGSQQRAEDQTFSEMSLQGTLVLNFNEQRMMKKKTLSEDWVLICGFQRINAHSQNMPKHLGKLNKTEIDEGRKDGAKDRCPASSALSLSLPPLFCERRITNRYCHTWPNYVSFLFFLFSKQPPLIFLSISLCSLSKIMGLILACLYVQATYFDHTQPYPHLPHPHWAIPLPRYPHFYFLKTQILPRRESMLYWFF